MKAIKRVSTIVVLLVAAALASFPGLTAAAPDNQGTEFIVGFMQNLSGANENTVLFLTGSTATTATVEAPGIGFVTTTTITPGTITSVALSNAIRATGSGTIQNKGIRITAAAEITVYGLNQRRATTDAFLGLPTDILGTDHLVPSYFNLTAGIQSEFQIIGTVDGTQVTITPTNDTAGGVDVGSVSAASSTTFTLDRMESIQFKALGGNAADLTGTEILSSQPVAVMAGHQCVNVPVGTTACDHLVEQVPPTSTWGTSFLTVPLATRTAGDRFRIMAAADSTTVRINGTLVRYDRPGRISRGRPLLVDLRGDYYEWACTGDAVLQGQQRGWRDLGPPL